jgi:hypothetical protein
MSKHEQNAARVALAAAGVLSPEELREVEQHARECPACRRELEVWGVYARGLGQLPKPELSPGLVARTQARVLRERSAAAERRQSNVLFGALAAFSWANCLVMWLVVRAVTGGSLEVFGWNLVSAVPWLLLSSLPGWLTAGVVAAAIARQSERRFS